MFCLMHQQHNLQLICNIEADNTRPSARPMQGGPTAFPRTTYQLKTSLTCIRSSYIYRSLKCKLLGTHAEETTLASKQRTEYLILWVWVIHVTGNSLLNQYLFWTSVQVKILNKQTFKNTRRSQWSFSHIKQEVTCLLQFIFSSFWANFKHSLQCACDLLKKEFKVCCTNSAEFKFKININLCTCCVGYLVVPRQKD